MKAAAASEGSGRPDAGSAVAGRVRVLLVRHAKAGDRRRAAGPDVARPLSRPGRAQAAALATSLWPLVSSRAGVGEGPPPGVADGDAVLAEPGPGNGEKPAGVAERRGRPASNSPVEVYSSPALRCVETVAPLAVSLGATVVEVPALGEGDLGAALDFLRGLRDRLRFDGARGGLAVAVACTHGDILPGAVAALAHEAGAHLPAAVPASKASTWMLEWEPDASLCHAGYLAPPA